MVDSDWSLETLALWVGEGLWVHFKNLNSKFMCFIITCINNFIEFHYAAFIKLFMQDKIANRFHIYFFKKYYKP